MYDIELIREDFPVLKDVIYFDNGATTQTPVQAVRAMEDYFFKYAANHGRGAHGLARQTTEHYENARETVARFLNAPEENTVFTRNTTESINLVAQGLQWEKGDHVITTLVEHHSNLLPWMRLREQGVEMTVVEPDDYGIVDPAKIEEAITNRTKVIAVTHISNVFGSVQDVESICKLAGENGILSVIDGAQSAGHTPVDFEKIGCDFFAAPGHKALLGPQGTGILCMKDPSIVKPLNIGGGAVTSVTTTSYELDRSPSRFEAGTPNIPGVIGLGRAVEYVEELGVENIESHEKKLAKKAAKGLAAIDGIKIYGPEDRAPVVPFNLNGMHPHDVALILDETRRICVRSGYHCAMPGIVHMGLEGTVRASFGPYNTSEEVELLIETMEEIALLI
ncbi:cysteine desulfurase/selenocysteine lyase [Methanohalophilus levihalophilus]|uniref:cysteine desulfurase n=1 Tax=Methanohalophilus levihalophilus TaxID=1431282 RepID=UPI001AE4581C|nr:cysteine desulfurase [Methanohalophilus levihalophilus]MBP2030138.1 cysteine desulfurase/selenocysteine lyase [Methanohalophilus levihalophilus]